MIEDGRRIPNLAALEADYAVVGAGAAGVTLALELTRAGHQVILVEAGGVHRAGRSLELYEGELADPTRHLPLDRDRYRQLGGTTSLWGGRCIPFDPIDFESRDYVPHSGWPITAAEMRPYFERAHVYCECGPFTYDAAEALPAGAPPLIPSFSDGDLQTSTIERWSPPTHFGKRYAAEMGAAPNLRVLLNAPVTGVRLDAASGAVRSIDIKTFTSTQFSVRARHFILAGGGIEVTRLLLASDDVAVGGIGNHSDWLGRGYQCHLSGVIAKAVFGAKLPVIYGYETDKAGVFCRRRFTFSDEVQRREQILNTHILLDRPLMPDPEHGSGLLSLAFFAKSLGGGKRHLTPGRGKYALYWAHARNVLCGSPEILSFLPQFLRKRFLQGRRIPSLLLRSRSNAYHLYYHAEQIPNRESRISLADGPPDPLGMRRVHLDYRVCEPDVESVMKAHAVIERELERAGAGRLEYLTDDPRRTIRDHQAVLGHHIGTTRTARRAVDGVVDENCRVHGVANLWIASSSTFPTSSQANPTLMIVAMALRLGDYLRQQASSGSAGPTQTASPGT